MRHRMWYQIECYLDKITDTIGHEIYDTRCGKWWDVGQAVCAEAYGPDWQNHPIFIKWNGKDDDEPPEPRFVKCAAQMAKGHVPEWTLQSEENDE